MTDRKEYRKNYYKNYYIRNGRLNEVPDEIKQTLNNDINNIKLLLRIERMLNSFDNKTLHTIFTYLANKYE